MLLNSSAASNVFRKVKMILNEGGNVFADTDQGFNSKEVKHIIATIQKRLPDPIKLIPVGSAADLVQKAKLGDMDLMVDEDAVFEVFHANDAKEARKKMQQFFIDYGFECKLSGVNVHVRVPLEDGAAQVDIMVVKNAERVSKFHQHAPVGDDATGYRRSAHKGVNKQILISQIAKDKGGMYSAFQGALYARTPEGKKGPLIADNIEDVAKALFGPQATAATLGNVENILQALGPHADHYLEKLSADQNYVAPEQVKESLQVGTTDWFTAISNKISL